MVQPDSRAARQPRCPTAQHRPTPTPDSATPIDARPDRVRAEIGVDTSVFGTHQRLCSWAKTSPRTMQSGRKKGKAMTGKGNPYLRAALGQMATGAAKTDTFLGARYRRLIKRMPKPKALPRSNAPSS